MIFKTETIKVYHKIKRIKVPGGEFAKLESSNEESGGSVEV
ncbi:MAG TPA: hypothetical protein VFC65_16825 [Prolixibacteraceae bacterium]|nr:hypothetical protein [Prolixibacteraceae bacterium]